MSTAAMAARGVSPYLPLQLSPEIESRIERLMILAGEPVLARPLSAASVLDALPAACEVDPALCAEVRNHLAGYMRSMGMNHASVTVYTSDGPDTALPSRHGMSSTSRYGFSLQSHWQAGDFVLVNKGVLAYSDEITPTGTFISVGREFAQVDLGYRDRWWSPMTDGPMVIGTQAATMPSLTVSNYAPLTRFRLRYEVFVGRMSHSDRIVFDGGFTAGRPSLAGMHVSLQPFDGWSIGFNRLMQFGGGERGGLNPRDLFKALFSPSRYDNLSSNGLSQDDEFGNQVASITTRLVMPGRLPFAVYFEYAGEDTSAQSDIRIGNAALSGGIHFPRLFSRYELVVELGEWQNAWYVHSTYQDGLLHKGNVLGHWGADYRVVGDGVGARSAMLRVVRHATGGGSVSAVYRTLDNQSYSAPDYSRARLLEVRYSRPWRQFHVGTELYAGRTVFGDSFSMLGVFVRY